jgi:hypothetical protein
LRENDIVLRKLGIFVIAVALLVLTAWATAALYFDFPFVALRTPLAITYVTAVVVGTLLVPSRTVTIAILAGGFCVVCAWWFTLKPSNGRAWQPDVAETAWAEINGDEVVLHKVRNCDYVTELNYTPHWETRTVRLSQLAGIDIALIYWGSPWIAHTIISFRFVDAPPVAMSIETRKEIGESYSAVRGLFRQFELIYIVADERDVIRLRTNYRRGEDVYLYRTIATPAQARDRFMEYLAVVNELHQTPRWYNAATSNCTTSIRAQRSAARRTPWDWRMLLNGKADEMLYQHGALVTSGLPFAELKKSALINARARMADKSPEFSRLIREKITE